MPRYEDQPRDTRRVKDPLLHARSAFTLLQNDETGRKGPVSESVVGGTRIELVTPAV